MAVRHRDRAIEAHQIEHPILGARKIKSSKVWLGVALLGVTPVHASCGLAFCTINTNWNMQGLAPEPGIRLDLRYEYVRQDQPMSGSDKVSVGQIPRHHDEVRTTNHNILATLDYTINTQWAVSAIAPVIDADHEHVHNHRGAQLMETWDFTRLGDVRVLGRYQSAAGDVSEGKLSFYGFNFGLKLPTGSYHVTNDQGVPAERSLQPGTGTTDGIIGAYFSQVLPAADSSWFMQALAQAPFNSRDDYKPGAKLAVDIGYRRELGDKAALMVQLNALWKRHDSGSQSEPADTGGRFFYVSPGWSYAIGKQSQLYTFLQVPLYQHVRGVQLTADWSAVLGFTTRF